MKTPRGTTGTIVEKTGSFASRHPALLLGTAAAALSAVWVAQRARKAERDNPAEGKFIEVDGVKLHYRERGRGPAVVLLHGNAVSLQDFVGSGVFDKLAARCRVIAFDSPGFGHSERPRDRLWTASAQAELLHKAFALLDIEKPVVVGHSWGTLIALGLALDHQPDLRGLVLISGYYYPTLRFDAPLAVPVALPIVGDVMRYTVTPLAMRATLNGAIKTMFAPRPVPRDYFDPVSRELMLRPSQLRAVAEDAAFMVPAASSFHERYGELQLPVTILAGGEDKVIDPQANSCALHRDLPHSDLKVFPGVGHMLHYAEPDDVVAAVERMVFPASVAPLDQTPVDRLRAVSGS